MEEIFNIEILKNLSVNPVMMMMFFLAGYTATEKLNLHLCFAIFHKNKAYPVFLLCIPIAVIYLITGSKWEEVLGTYLFVNTFYSHGLKQLQKLLP
jgi:hypothetical protein